MALRILITNISLVRRSGTTIYARDLALELQRQGAIPALYALAQGVIADELKAVNIPVVSSLRHWRFHPDIIHAHHYTPTLAALQHYPGVPAIHVCHDHLAFIDKTLIHPRIHRHFAVSQVCLERVRREGVLEGQAQLLLNFVDTKRFRPRLPLPRQPRRALIFSNYANLSTQVVAVTEACRRLGLDLDVVGAGVGRCVARPETILGLYDLVFAKGKAAIEALAMGVAVILCDAGGVGPLVTSAQFDALRAMNFGFQALQLPLQPEIILRQILRYDPQDAMKVSELLRTRASLEGAVKKLVEVYHAVVADQRKQPADRAEPRVKTDLARQRLNANLDRVWLSLPASFRKGLKTIPGFYSLMRLAIKYFFESDRWPRQRALHFLKKA